MCKFGVTLNLLDLKIPNKILSTLLFPKDIGYDLSWQIFKQTELGQLYEAIPFDLLSKQFERFKNLNPQGTKPRFTIAGGLGLMFLKHYLNLSDAKLIERLNCDWQLQFFCGIRIEIDKPIIDSEVVGRWRRFFGLHVDIDIFQDDLAAYWKPYLKDTHGLMDDATCYESYIKYPTDVKLLNDCCEWLFDQIQKICEENKLRKHRSIYKYNEQRKRQLAYQKRKKKPYQARRRRVRQLLFWVNRGIELLQQLLNLGGQIHEGFKPTFYKKIKTIKIIYSQQEYHNNHPEKKVKNRIVSFYKPYIRPIVRGKEGKRVEFGAKVHMSQVDQINFIEHLSFEAFHEGNRMWKSMFKHNKRFEKCRQYGADQIYATNKNRKYCTKKKIVTCFKKKGRESKNEDQKKKLRKEIGKARSTQLEGSFGNEKNHYLLSKVKARLEETEIAWILFGIHTANAVKIGRRIEKKKYREKHKNRFNQVA